MRLLRTPDPFRPGDEGEPLFHPLGRLGPAYVVSDEALRRRLVAAHRLLWLGGYACLGFFLVWLASYRGKDPIMYIAPPLLAFGLVLLAYRLRLRRLLRDVPLTLNRWRRSAAGDEPHSGDPS